MNDLDPALRSLARALTDSAPPPPPFPSDTAKGKSHGRRSILHFAAAAAAAAAIVGVTGTAMFVSRDNPEDIVTSVGDHPTTQSYLCDANPAIRVLVPGATNGPTVGPAPGTAPVGDEQRAIHWTGTEGTVELRWPARQPPLYNDGTAVTSTLAASELISAERTEIDAHPVQDRDDPGTMFDPDVIIERPQPGTPRPVAPCDLLELTVITDDGHWRSGLRAVGSDGDLEAAYELVNLQPRIIERRPVGVAPDTAIRCQGSDRFGTPPNRTGGPDRSLSGPQPADVLMRYLATTPTAQQSGYVEMTEPDGSLTYGVDPSGDGWTTLVFVARDGDNWYLDGWTASGC